MKIRSKRVALAVDLWLIYARAGRPVRPTQAARAAGCSPTAVLAQIKATWRCADVCRGRSGSNWNWGAPANCGSVGAMEKWISNGQEIETYPEGASGAGEASAEVARAGSGITFAEAIAPLVDGIAINRHSDLDRVVFLGPDGLFLQGTQERGICAPLGPYVPTKADLEANDWGLAMFPANEAALALVGAAEEMCTCGGLRYG